MSTPSKPSSFYQESIILFGIILPLLLFLAVVGGGYLLSNNASSYLAQKKVQSAAYEKGRKGMEQLEELFGKKKSHLDRWDKLLATETGGAFSTNLREITDKLPGEEFTQTTFDPSKTAAGFGSVSAQPSSQVKLSTRGTFRATQKAILALETKMPQLQLQEVKIDPNATSSSALNFQFSYTAWEK